MVNFYTILCSVGLHKWTGWYFTVSDVTDRVRCCERCWTRQYRGAMTSYGRIIYTERGVDAVEPPPATEVDLSFRASQIRRAQVDPIGGIRQDLLEE